VKAMPIGSAVPERRLTCCGRSRTTRTILQDATRRMRVILLTFRSKAFRLSIGTGSGCREAPPAAR
jgi:hypothetical protein